MPSTSRTSSPARPLWWLVAVRSASPSSDLIPNGLDFKHAALTEPMAVGLHAVNKSNIQPGETALVVGCGPIGIAIIASLRARGVESVVAADFSSKRRGLRF